MVEWLVMSLTLWSGASGIASLEPATANLEMVVVFSQRDNTEEALSTRGHDTVF